MAPPPGSPATPKKGKRLRSTTPERLPRRAGVESARTTREPDAAAPSSSSSSCSTIPGNTYHRDGAPYAIRGNPHGQGNRKIGGAAARPRASVPFIYDDDDDDDDSYATSSTDEGQPEDEHEESVLACDGEGEGEGEIPGPNSEPAGRNGWDVVGRPPFDNLSKEDEEKAAMDMEGKIRNVWRGREADVALSAFTGDYKDRVITLMARGTPPAFVTVPAAQFLVRQLGTASFKRSYACRHPAWARAYSALNPRAPRGMRNWIQQAKTGESQEPLYEEGVKRNKGRHCPVPRFPKGAKTDRQTLWELTLLTILCRALESANPSGRKKSRVHKQSLGKTRWLENDPINGLGRVRPADRNYGILQSSPDWVRFLNHIPEGKLGEPPRPPQGATTPSAPSPGIEPSPQPSETSHRPKRAATKPCAIEDWPQSWGPEADGDDDGDWRPEPETRVSVSFRGQPRDASTSVEAQRSSRTLATGASDAGRSRGPGSASPVVSDSASDGGGPSIEEPSQPTPPATDPDPDSSCLTAEVSTPTPNNAEDREDLGVDATARPRAAESRPRRGASEKSYDGCTRPPTTCGALGEVQKAVERAQKHSKEAMTGTGKMASAGARKDWAKLEHAVGNLEDPMESTQAALKEAVGAAKAACRGDADAARSARRVVSRLEAAQARSKEAQDAQNEAARVVWKRKPEATRPVTVRLVELVEGVDEALRDVLNVLAAGPKRKAGDDGGAATKRSRSSAS